jgi:hypothetical protein
MTPVIRLPSPRRTTLALVAIVAVLTALSLFGQVSKYYLGHPRLKGFVPAFYVDLESNVPTWYSSLALGLAGGILALIATLKWRTRDRFRFHWAGLSAGFVLLSIDEVAMLHEYPIDPLRRALDAGGALYYPWVLPAMAVVVVLAIVFASFVRHLPARTRRQVCLAAAVFLSGAIGMEMLSGVQADAAGEQTFVYAMIISVEELLEMLGVVIFIHALLAYVRSEFGVLQIGFSRKDAANRDADDTSMAA